MKHVGISHERMQWLYVIPSGESDHKFTDIFFPLNQERKSM